MTENLDGVVYVTVSEEAYRRLKDSLEGVNDDHNLQLLLELLS